MHMSTHPNSELRVCCHAAYDAGRLRRADDSIFKITDSDAMDSWNSKTLVNLRKNMINNEKSQICEKCIREETYTGKSPRILANRKWMFEFEKSAYPKPKIKYLDLRLGNLCNLKCRMCWPGASTQWLDEYKMIVPSYNNHLMDRKMSIWPQENYHLDTIKKIAPYLEEIYLTGGEPTLAESQYEMYEYLINNGFSKNIGLSYNTNATNIKDKMIKMWGSFKHVEVSLSIDAVGPLHRYIRHPASWDSVEKTFLKYKRLYFDKKIWLSISPTVQINSVFNLDELISYFSLHNLEDQIWFNILDFPKYLNIQALPVEVKAILTNKYANIKLLDPVVKFMNADDLFDTQWPNFLNYTKKLDLFRNENLLDVIPDLQKYYE